MPQNIPIQKTVYLDHVNTRRYACPRRNRMWRAPLAVTWKSRGSRTVTEGLSTRGAADTHLPSKYFAHLIRVPFFIVNKKDKHLWEDEVTVKKKAVQFASGHIYDLSNAWVISSEGPSIFASGKWTFSMQILPNNTAYKLNTKSINQLRPCGVIVINQKILFYAIWKVTATRKPFDESEM